MATYPIPRYEGQIEIVLNVNDQISFHDDSGAGDVIAVLTAGLYWLPALCTHIKAQMEAASTGGGGHATFTITISNTTGQMTIASDHNFTLYNRAADNRKFLSGGDNHPDTGVAMVAGEYGFNHVGFPVEAAAAGVALTFTGTSQISNSFYPSEPPAKDSEYELEKEVAVLETPAGYLYHADHSGVSKGIERRSWRYEFQGTLSRFIAAYWWWKWYASCGGVMHYYADRTVASYVAYVLTGPSCQKFPFDQRLQGYAWFSGEFQGQKVW